MKKFLKLVSTLLATILLLFPAIAQNEKDRVANYINQYKDLAIAEMLRTGIPASIKLAQGILETGGGQSELANVGNNHFGIKCKTEWTGDRMFHDDDAKGECFRKYESPDQSYRDHSDFLRNRAHYAFLFKLDPTDYEGWAKGLKKAGYATNPAYPQRLMKIIVENNLQHFTLLALQKQQHREQELFATNNTQPARQQEVVAHTPQKNNERPATATLTVEQKATVALSAAKSRYNYNEPFTINEVKVLYAQAGTSLLALANKHNVTLKKLLEFNDLKDDGIMVADQLVYLSKKAKRGSKEVHIVEANETLYDIAQKEGVQLQSLLEFNRLQKGMEPAVGEKIFLKAPSPSTPKLASTSFSTKQVTMK
ncbi:glucosaminidase domain-containing protein [Aridibaculum aurantiacum]|uniref:glucosaminidase domain-containing protein n=1 Tax=Aridibaculum aurantiacum TaxID=2810307 RepID=UPI001A963878|nr:glucosaminidase domain-containing protein [Aridibaculum aurantiacum]